MPERDERACSVCGEMILATAKKCKHCGEWIQIDLASEPEAVVSGTETPAMEDPNDQSPRNESRSTVANTKSENPSGLHTLIGFAAFALVAWFLLPPIGRLFGGLFGGSSVPASCAVINKGSCSIRSVSSSGKVELKVEGYTEGSANVQCTAYNAAGERIGGDRKDFRQRLSKINSVETLRINASGTIARISCSWYST